MASGLDLLRRPFEGVPNILVQPDGALSEAAGDLFLLLEGPVAIGTIVSGEGEVAKSVQPELLNVPPLWAEHPLPSLVQLLVLGENVLNAVGARITDLLASLILEGIEKVKADALMIEIVRQQRPFELGVIWKGVARGHARHSSLERGEWPRLIDPGAPLCHRIEELAGLGEMVPNFQQAACRRLSDDGRMVFAKCYASCRYKAQFDHQEPRVIFTSHAYLRWQLPVQGDVSVRMIDEAFWSTLQHSQRLLLDAWLTAPRPKTVTEQWQGHWDTAHAGDLVGAAKRLRDTKGPLVYDYGSIARIGEAGSIVADALREGRSPIVALEDAGIDETLVERFADWEIRDLPEAPVRLEQNSAMQAEIIRSFNTAERKAALARHRVWRLIADDFEYGETGRLSWRALGPCQVTGQPLHAIGLHVRHDLPLDAPILMIDADLSPLIVGAYAPTTRFVRVDAEQTAEVVQVSDRTMSTTWFLDPEKGRGRRDLVRAIIADDAQLVPVRCCSSPRRRSFARSIRTSIRMGTTLRTMLSGVPSSGRSPPGSGRGLRGINRYRDWPRMIVLGRLEPPMNEVETVARAIFGVVPPVFDGNRQRSVLSAAYTMVDGSERLTEISGLPYPEGNAVLMQMREVLTNQAIARLRLVAPDSPAPEFPETPQTAY